jgi:hypothetical protein
MLWEIGRDPTMRCCLVGATNPHAYKLLGAIIRHIEANPRLREVFPNLRKSTRRGDQWNNRNMTVAGAGMSKDPTIQARGWGAKDLLGSRLDLAVVDDLLNMENTRTQQGRDKLSEWFDDYIVTRITDDVETGTYGRCFLIGNPWHVDDLIARLGQLPGWQTMVTPAVLNPDDPVERWVPTWPSQWPIERLLERRSKMLPHSFARKYLCRVLDASHRRFLLAWINHSFWLGRGRHLMTSQPTQNGRKLRCFTILDPGFGKRDSDALTALLTIALDSKDRRIVANLQTGRWTGPEILRLSAEECRTFDSELFVEGNAAQRWMAEFGREFAGLNAQAINTGSEKWDEEYGVEGCAILMKNGYIVFPSGASGTRATADPEVQALADECFNFDPSAHTGDRLMALWMGDKAVREYLAPRVDNYSSHTIR